MAAMLPGGAGKKNEGEGRSSDSVEDASLSDDNRRLHSESQSNCSVVFEAISASSNECVCILPLI